MPMLFYILVTPAEMAAAAIVFPIVGAILVAARLWSRIKKLKRLDIEDWLVLPALLFMTGMGATTLVGVATNSEGYVSAVPDEQQASYMNATIGAVFWNTEWMQPLALGCIKLSFLFLYRRVFISSSRPGDPLNIVSLFSIALIAVWMLGFFVAVMLACPGHISAYWAPTAIKETYCWSSIHFTCVLCWSDVGTDLLVLIMPLRSIFRLRLTTKRKITLAGVFLLGGLALVASIARAVFYASVVSAEYSGLADLDPVLVDSNGIFWILVETGLALIAVNLPVLYGSAKGDGVGNVIRSLRNFVSNRTCHSSSSDRGKSFSNNSYDSKASYGSYVPSSPKLTAWYGHNPSMIEEGRILITNTVRVDEK